MPRNLTGLKFNQLRQGERHRDAVRPQVILEPKIKPNMPPPYQVKQEKTSVLYQGPTKLKQNRNSFQKFLHKSQNAFLRRQ